jgi:hypothetical protein
MKWGNEKKKYDWLNTYPKYELSPLAAASVLTLGISAVDSEKSKSLESIVSCANCRMKCSKSSLSSQAVDYSDLSFVYFGLSLALSAAYFSSMGFYSELVNLTKK